MRNRLVLTALLFYIFIFGLIISCSVNEVSNEIIQVKYGTSFGECVGYCKMDLTISAGLVKFDKSGWIDTIRTVTFTKIQDESNWYFFQSELKVTSFLDLPPVIGCPDCADGGAEWLEIELANGVKHKVTFEYKNEPALVKDYISRLRKLIGEFEDWEAD